MMSTEAQTPPNEREVDIAPSFTTTPNGTNDIDTHELTRALDVVGRTLNQTNLDAENFSQALTQAVRSLPQYATLERSVQASTPEDTARQIFDALRALPLRTSDDAPDDGVLVSSMAQGTLRCAGRTLLGSTWLTQHGVRHWVTSTIAGGTGHSVLVIETSPTTLAYCDAQNNLFFTFPRTAMSGDVQPPASRHTLHDFNPGELDGLSSMSRTFVLMEPTIGLASQYLDNVQSALDAHRDDESRATFAGSVVTPDATLAQAMPHLKKRILGTPCDIIEREVGDLYSPEHMTAAEDHDREFKQLCTACWMQTHGEEEAFCRHMAILFRTHPCIAQVHPYLPGASDVTRTAAARHLWQLAQQLMLTPTPAGDERA